MRKILLFVTAAFAVVAILFISFGRRATVPACRSQGPEFVLDGEPAYPSGYPELMQEITVIGRFEVYYEGAEKYCRLVSARIL
ncbi:MAG: hypothetical protein IJR61_06540 [Clostridia bacterium]|nr:hypothetical protein [Clostridia bacterium]